MKYSCEVLINAPVEKVIRLFDNPDNMYKWMEGLKSFEHISGNEGEVGAKSKLKFKMGKRQIDMIETITVKNFPEEFSGIYEVKGVRNIVKNKFVALSENETRYITEQEFQFSGFMKAIAFLMPGTFKKQSMKYLFAFKNFVENN